MKYFGTDGIRGKAGEFLTGELAFRVGTSLAVLGLPHVLIGRDTRESGPMLSDNIADGAKFVGLNVCDLGVVSTPMLSYLSGRYDSVGVMITASHNPYEDNGIKVFRSGKKLFAGEEQALEEVLNGRLAVRKATENGKDLPAFDAFGRYLELIEPVLTTSSMKVALDLANGACYEIGPRVFSRITDRLVLTGNRPDGRNINEKVGSTHLEHIRGIVTANECDYGFAFDGDGDRLLVVDASGRVFDGDALLLIFASYLQSLGELKHSTVVLTKMSNLGILQAFRRRGIDVFLTDVGDKYVLEAMETHDYILGGENSGHLINRTLLNTGDGILNAAFLMKILETSGRSLAKWIEDVVYFPEKLVNLKGIDKALASHPAVITLVERWQRQFGSEGKILVRPSGTEPLIRISVSAKTLDSVEQCIREITETIQGLVPNK
jgi:phosphoglucosamine mutase